MQTESRRRLGGALIALGVLAWAPFFYLLATGERISIFPFLAVHLTGVLSGSALRRSALPREASGEGGQRIGRRRRILSLILTVLGVLAWAPYLYLHNALGRDISVGPFLAVHLTGVLGGAALRASLWLDRLRPRA